VRYGSQESRTLRLIWRDALFRERGNRFHQFAWVDWLREVQLKATSEGVRAIL
jgi:hypothetical protein